MRLRRPRAHSHPSVTRTPRALAPLAAPTPLGGTALIDGSIQSGPMLVVYLALVALAITDPNGENEAAIIPVVIGLLLAYAWGLGWWIFDRVIRQGRTGQSVGKRVMKIRLVAEHTWQPIGAGTALGREFAHLADVYSLYIGYLWPLWDAKRQTFADKMCSSIVLRAR